MKTQNYVGKQENDRPNLFDRQTTNRLKLSAHLISFFIQPKQIDKLFKFCSINGNGPKGLQQCDQTTCIINIWSILFEDMLFSIKPDALVVQVVFIIKKNKTNFYTPTALGLICFCRPNTVRICPIMPSVQQFIRLRCPCEQRAVRRSANQNCSSCDWMSGNHNNNIMAACVLQIRTLSPLSWVSSTT